MLVWLLLGFWSPAIVDAKQIDPDSPTTAFETRSYHDGKIFSLVFSDEFERDGRTFCDGCDPRWTGMQRPDNAQTDQGKKSLVYYHADAITTNNGTLNITTTSDLTHWKGLNPFTNKQVTFQKEFKSGMVTTWNKFCFTGGIIEARIKLPGAHHTSGLWPAFWLFGNLGRALYDASNNLVWPWNYDICNQDFQRAQEISACNQMTHYGMHPFQGRGATEIDIIEVMAGSGPVRDSDGSKLAVHAPYASMTLQVAPGVDEKRPIDGYSVGKDDTWYKDLIIPNGTCQNTMFYGSKLAATSKNEPAGRTERQSYQTDGISALHQLYKDNWDSFHDYRLEWSPGAQGYLLWYVDGALAYGIHGKSLTLTNTIIPTEPSYIILNTAVSNSWGFPKSCPKGCTCDSYDCNGDDTCAIPSGLCDQLPAHMLVEHMRVYQSSNDSSHSLGCDPPDFPTKTFILGHKDRYMQPTDKRLMEDLQVGGGTCRKHSLQTWPTCGEGTCIHGRCSCTKGWVGPNCLVPDYKFEGTERRPFPFIGPFLPMQLAAAIFLIGLAYLAVTLGVAINSRWKEAQRK